MSLDNYSDYEETLNEQRRRKAEEFKLSRSEERRVGKECG